MSTNEGLPPQKERWSAKEISNIFIRPSENEIRVDRHINILSLKTILVGGAWDFMEVRGFDHTQWEQRFGIRLFVRHDETDYLHELKIDKKGSPIRARIETMAKVGDTSIVFAQRLLDDRGSIICGSSSVVVATKNGEPVRVPDEFREAVVTLVMRFGAARSAAPSAFYHQCGRSSSPTYSSSSDIIALLS